MSRFRYQGPISPQVPSLSQFNEFQENYEKSGKLIPKFRALQDHAIRTKRDLINFSYELNNFIIEKDESPIEGMPEIKDFKTSIDFMNQNIWKKADNCSITHLHNPVSSFAVSWDRTMMAMGSYSTLLFSEINGFGEKTISQVTLPGPLAFARVLSYHPSDRLLAAGAASGSFHLFDTKQNKVVSTLNMHKDLLTGVAFSSCGTKIVSASRDGILNITDITKSKVQRQIKLNDSISSFVLSKNDDYMLLATKEGKVALFDNREEGKIQYIDAHYGNVTSLATNNEGIFVSGGGDHCVRIWDIRETAVAAGTITSNVSNIMTMQFIDDSNFVYSLADGTFKQYAISESFCKSQKQTFVPPICFCYLPETKMLVSSTESSDLLIHSW